MAEISKIVTGIVNGVMRPSSMASNTLVLDAVRLGGLTGNVLTNTILGNLINLQNGSEVSYTNGSAGHAHDSRYYTEGEVDIALGLKLSLAGGTMTGAITLSGAPTADLHASSKKYVDDGLAAKLALAGGTLTGALILAADPTVDLGAATKQYVDGKVGTGVSASDLASTSSGKGASLVGIHDAGSLFSAATVEAALAELKGDVSAVSTAAQNAISAESDARVAADALKLALAGGTMTGAITLSGAPTVDLHAASKKYVDDADALKLALAGGTMTGAITLSGAPTSDLHAATKKYADDGLAAKLSLAGGTMTGALILNADPTDAKGAVTKQYADAIAAGFDAHEAVHLATAAALPAVTASGTGVGKKLTLDAAGDLTVDGHVAAAGDRILVKNQAEEKDNGVYVYTAYVASPEAMAFLTRSSDFDGSPVSEVAGGDTVFVNMGTANGGTTWGVLKVGTLAVDTDDFLFTQVAGITDIQAGSGLSKTGNVLEVNVDASTIEISSDALRVKDGGIVEAKIGTGAVTSDKLGSSSVIEGKIGTGAVTEGKIGALAVTNGKIGLLAVDTAQIAAGAVTNAKIGLLAVDSAQIAGSAVIEAKIGSGAVTEGKIGAAAVTEAKIGALAVTNGKIGLLAVDTAQIAASAVTNAKIASGAITATNAALDSSVAGEGIALASGVLNLDIVASSGLELTGTGAAKQLDVVLNATAPGLVKASGLGIDWATSTSDAKAWKASDLAASAGSGKIGFDNATAALPGAPTTVKAAIDALAARPSDAIAESVVMGETMTAGLKAVRFAMGSETLGRVYKADPTEGTPDPFYVVGLVKATGSEAAGDSIVATKFGKMYVLNHGLTTGVPFYLDSNGAVTSTAPSTAGEAVIRLGVVRDSNNLEINIQVVGVN